MKVKQMFQELVTTYVSRFYYATEEPMPEFVRQRLKKIGIKKVLPEADWIGRKILLGEVIYDSENAMAPGRLLYLNLPKKPWFGPQAQPFWIYINGHVGSGKTNLVRLIYDQLDIVTTSIFMNDIRNEMPTSMFLDYPYHRALKMIYAFLNKYPHEFSVYFPAFRRDIAMRYYWNKLFAFSWKNITLEELKSLLFLSYSDLGIIRYIKRLSNFQEVATSIYSMDALNPTKKSAIIQTLQSFMNIGILTFKDYPGVYGLDEVIKDLKERKTVDFSWGSLTYDFNLMIASFFITLMQRLNEVQFKHIPCIYIDEAHRLFEFFGSREESFEIGARKKAIINQINEYRGKYWFVLASQSFLNFRDVLYLTLVQFPYWITARPNAKEMSVFWEKFLDDDEKLDAMRYLIEISEEEKHVFALVDMRKRRVIVFRSFKAISSNDMSKLEKLIRKMERTLPELDYEIFQRPKKEKKGEFGGSSKAKYKDPEFLKKVEELYKQGYSLNKMSALLGVANATLHKALHLLREEGRI